MANESWMQPALQTSEAVLLPALETASHPTQSSPTRYLPAPQYHSAFVAADENWEQPAARTLPVQSHGSMAGRSVLRAVGVHTAPICKSRRREN